MADDKKKVSAFDLLSGDPEDTAQLAIIYNDKTYRITIVDLLTRALKTTLFDANSILAADTDDTPAALTIAEQTLLGRITAGNIVGLTATQIRTLLNIEDGSTADQTGAEIKAAYEVEADAYTDTKDTKLSGIATGADVTGSNAPQDHATEHKVGGADTISLDEFSPPSDNTNLNVDNSAHGLCPKLSNVVTEFLNGQGGYTVPAGGGGGASGIAFLLRGDAYVGTKQTQILMAASATISKVVVYCDTAPTGADLIVDVNKNGTTIFTTQTKRPQVADGTNTDDSDTPDVTALAQDDRVSVDIDQIGSSVVGGNDVLVTIVFA